jgi:hypothetical protein
VNNELYQSQEPADVVAIPHSDDWLNSAEKKKKKNLYFCFLYTYIYFSCRVLARIQYPEGPATGHLGTGFS